MCRPIEPAPDHEGLFVYGPYGRELSIYSDLRSVCLAPSLEDISEFVLFVFGGVIPLPLCAGPKDGPYSGVVESSIFMYYHKPLDVNYF
jgi:hypothetical protein